MLAVNASHICFILLYYYFIVFVLYRQFFPVNKVQNELPFNKNGFHLYANDVLRLSFLDTIQNPVDKNNLIMFQSKRH